MVQQLQQQSNINHQQLHHGVDAINQMSQQIVNKNTQSQISKSQQQQQVSSSQSKSSNATQTRSSRSSKSSKSSNKNSSQNEPIAKNIKVPPGFHHLVVNATDFVVPERYVDLQAIGVGAYGCVCSANDSLTGYKVAVKKLARPFQSLIHAKRTFRELRLLKHMHHENVIGLLDVFSPDENSESFQNLYLVTHLMGADLHNIVRVQKLTDDHVQFILYQLLRGLKYIHSAGIIHRDLKLANIAVNEDVELRILDFGLARMHSEEMTGYVATRWYRAPEIMLNWMRYDVTVDMWSIGCILGEMIHGKPLFPGKDYMDQLKLIMKLCGKPSQQDLDALDSEHARNFIDSLEDRPRADFKTVFQGANPLAIDLLEKLLVLDPEKRPTAVECLRHPYLETYHDSDDEPDCFEMYDEEIEKEEKNIDEWRLATWDEYQTFEPPMYDTDSDDYDYTDTDDETDYIVGQSE